MKNIFTVITFLIVMFANSFAKAQKAYEMITYQSWIGGNRCTLQLADGYLPASKVTIFLKNENRVFLPSSGAPDAHDELKFNIVSHTGSHKDSAGSWLTLKGLNDQVYPSLLKAVYWNGKVQKPVIFKELK